MHLSPQQLRLCVQEYQGQYILKVRLSVSSVCSSIHLPVWLSHLSTCPLSSSASVCRSTRASTPSTHTWLSHLSVHPPDHLFTCTPGCLTCPLDHLFACTPVCPPVYLHPYSCLSYLSVLPHLCKYAEVLWSEHLQVTLGCLTCLSIHLVLCQVCLLCFSSVCLFCSPVSPAMLCTYTLYKN